MMTKAQRDTLLYIKTSGRGGEWRIRRHSKEMVCREVLFALASEYTGRYVSGTNRTDATKALNAMSGLGLVGGFALGFNGPQQWSWEIEGSPLAGLFKNFMEILDGC